MFHENLIVDKITYPCENRFIFFLNGLSNGFCFFEESSLLDFLSLSKYFSNPEGGFSHQFVHCFSTVLKLGST